MALEVVLISDHDVDGKSARSFDVHTEAVADVLLYPHEEAIESYPDVFKYFVIQPPGKT